MPAVSRPPLQPAPGGWIASTDAALLPILAAAMARQVATENAAAAHCQAIREGSIQHDPESRRWLITDRD